MLAKRIIIVSGHYGSGKTNIAVNLALDLKQQGKQVALADLDIVNPYFRSKDSEGLLAEQGIELICSSFANSNVDLPSLPQELYRITDDQQTTFVLDVGGDERGALALGRIAPGILKENDYEMLYVINCYRPLTKEPEDALEVMREIEGACHLPFTGIINNSNLGAETTKEDLLSSLPYAKEVAKLSQLPVVCHTVFEGLYPQLSQEESFYPIKLQPKI